MVCERGTSMQVLLIGSKDVYWGVTIRALPGRFWEPR
jgi:hypothetical protein